MRLLAHDWHTNCCSNRISISSFTMYGNTVESTHHTAVVTCKYGVCACECICVCVQIASICRRQIQHLIYIFTFIALPACQSHCIRCSLSITLSLDWFLCTFISSFDARTTTTTTNSLAPQNFGN